MDQPETSTDAATLVATLFAIIDGREFERLPEVFTEDAVYLRPGYPALEGADRLLTFYRDERVIGDGAHEVEHAVGGDGAAACWGRFRGHDREGRVLDERFADTYVLRDGRIARRETFFARPAI